MSRPWPQWFPRAGHLVAAKVVKGDGASFREGFEKIQSSNALNWRGAPPGRFRISPDQKAALEHDHFRMKHSLR